VAMGVLAGKEAVVMAAVREVGLFMVKRGGWRYLTTSVEERNESSKTCLETNEDVKI
jgi:hypothetical protein